MPMRTTAVTVAVAVALGGGAAACSGDDGEADELRAQLAEVTTERDELQARLDADAERSDKTVEVREAIRAILDDPAAYGTEDEAIDLLASYASSDARMRDDALGSATMRRAWHESSYGQAVDAEIEVVHQWFAPDGSQSGGLWVWRGTNLAGNPFELVGVQIDTHDDEGRVTDEWVIYPYPDDYVVEAFEGAGTPVSGIWDD